MKSMRFLMFLAAIPALMLVGCESVEGPEGPQGPAGSANVRSYTLRVAPGDWVESGSQGQANHMYTALIDTFSVMTDEIASGGMVLVYRIRADLFQTAYIPLPSEEPENGFDRRWDFLYAPGSIGFTVRHSDYNTIQPSSTENFKIVLAESINAKQAAELQAMRYEEAIAVLGAE